MVWCCWHVKRKERKCPYLVDCFLLFSGVWLVLIAVQASVYNNPGSGLSIISLHMSMPSGGSCEFQHAEHIWWTHVWGPYISIATSATLSKQSWYSGQQHTLNSLSGEAWAHQVSMLPLPTLSFHCSYLMSYTDYLWSFPLSKFPLDYCLVSASGLSCC